MLTCGNHVNRDYYLLYCSVCATDMFEMYAKHTRSRALIRLLSTLFCFAAHWMCCRRASPDMPCGKLGKHEKLAMLRSVYHISHI